MFSWKRKTKIYTVKSRLFKIALQTVLLIGAIVTLSLFALFEIQKSDLESRAASFMTRNVHRQVRVLLPAMLLEGQEQGLTLLLKRIKTEENLSEVNILADLGEIPPKFSRCLIEDNKPCVVRSDSEIGVVAPISESGHVYGYLIKCRLLDSLLTSGMYLRITIIILAVLLASMFVLLLLITRFFNNDFTVMLQQLIRWVEMVLEGENKAQPPQFALEEGRFLRDQIGNLIIKSENTRRQAAIANAASQVAHDIKSPLAALNMAVRDLSGLSEDRRLLIKSACTEINDIADNLSSRPGHIPVSERQFRSEPLAPIISMMVANKRMQYRELSGVKIEFHIENGSHGAFSKVEAIEFRRLLSNLVNNSVEAFEGQTGQISIFLSVQSHNTRIVIEDNGKGIPQNQLNQVVKKGVSIGKKDGSGLGLSHAIDTISDWNGDLALSSELGVGTKVTITLPLCERPLWFCQALTFNKNSTVVVLDDDPSIHLIWKDRLGPMKVAGKLKESLHFSSSEEIKKWLDTNSSGDFHYLIDFELIGSHKTGLDIIQELGISSKATLVTSRYDEENLQRECGQIAVTIIPKWFAGHIPISLSLDEEGSTNYVLLDDSPTTRLNWKLTAKIKGIEFSEFGSIKEFESSLSTISKNAKIYIDSNLGGDERGEDFAKRLYDQGYENLFMASSYSSSAFSDLPYIKDVIGKEPPWVN